MFSRDTAINLVCIGLMVAALLSLVSCSDNKPTDAEIWQDNCVVAGGIVLTGRKEFRDHWFCVKADTIEIMEVPQFKSID